MNGTMKTLFIFLICSIILVGVIDGFEYKFVNPKVFHQHNFPDILNRTDFENLGFFDAFLSGLYCAWFLLGISFLIKLFILKFIKGETDSEALEAFHIGLFFVLTFFNFVILFTFDEKRDSIYRNHKMMYIGFFLVEVASIAFVSMV